VSLPLLEYQEILSYAFRFFFLAVVMVFSFLVFLGCDSPFAAVVTFPAEKNFFQDDVFDKEIFLSWGPSTSRRSPSPQWGMILMAE